MSFNLSEWALRNRSVVRYFMIVLAVIGAVLGGYVLVQPLLNRVARRLV